MSGPLALRVDVHDRTSGESWSLYGRDTMTLTFDPNVVTGPHQVDIVAVPVDGPLPVAPGMKDEVVPEDVRPEWIGVTPGLHDPAGSAHWNMEKVRETLRELDSVEFHAVGKNGERVVFRVRSHERTTLELTQTYDQQKPPSTYPDLEPIWAPAWRAWAWRVVARTRFRAEDFIERGKGDV